MLERSFRLSAAMILALGAMLLAYAWTQFENQQNELDATHNELYIMQVKESCK